MKKFYTAHDLASDWWWDAKYSAVIAGGRVKWDALSYGPRGGIRMSRIDDKKWRAIQRHVSPKTKMILVLK